MEALSNSNFHELLVVNEVDGSREAPDIDEKLRSNKRRLRHPSHHPPSVRLEGGRLIFHLSTSFFDRPNALLRVGSASVSKPTPSAFPVASLCQYDVENVGKRLLLKPLAL